jgi:DNA-binding NarL/FixJ family response regulator
MPTSAVAAEPLNHSIAPSFRRLGAARQTAPATSVAIAHGRRLMRAGLRTLLERETGIDVVEAATGDEAVSVCQRVLPDVVLIDVDVPGLGCVEATQRIVSGSGARVMALTRTAADPRVFAMLVAGAAGLVLEDREPAVLVRAVRRLSCAWRPARRPRAGGPAHSQATLARVVDITHRRGEQ